jgi:TDG/mug DNA glycosylase family protein
MGFTRDELESFRDATVPDLIGPGLRLLFVGINPGLWTAATQTHFAHPGNRFYPALRIAGVVDRDIDRGTGMTDDDRRHLIERGVGITNVVARATAVSVCCPSWPSTGRGSSRSPGSPPTARPSGSGTR